MNAKGWMLVGGIALLVAIAAAVVFLMPGKAVTPEETDTEGKEVGNLEGQNLYANGEYGFTLRYPASAQFGEHNNPSAHGAWRTNAHPEGTGTTVFDVYGYRTSSETTYPRNYSAMVRLGVSDDPKELERCELTADDQGETALPDRVLNGTAWKAFSYGDAAMMRYQKGVSYRLLRDGKCFALEKTAIGSSYRDEPSPSDIPDETLEAEYAKLDAIVSTFTFVQ